MFFGSIWVTLAIWRGPRNRRDYPRTKAEVSRVLAGMSGADGLLEHLGRVKTMHERDIQKGMGEVYLPFALERKYPNAGREWG